MRTDRAEPTRPGTRFVAAPRSRHRAVSAVMVERFGTIVAMAFALGAVAASGAEPSLDYEFFKARVEPIFLKKRPDHTRCYACHVDSSNAFRLERLPPGAAFWTEAQSRVNFEMASRLVVPGDQASSRLLMMPLAPEAGGLAFHSGGRQFASMSDPDWKTLAEWVSGQIVSPRAGK